MLRNKYTGIVQAGLYASYALIILFFLGPLLWMFSLSFKTIPELFYIPPKLLPETISLDNYRFILSMADVFNNLRNSTQIVAVTILGTMILAIPGAYAFSRMRFRGKRFSQFALMFFNMLSPLVIAIPLYRYFARMGLLNNFWSLSLAYIALALPFATWTIKGYMDTIPVSMDEAGLIDGCTKFQVLSMIIMPVIIPGIISVLILVFVRSWSQFIIPFILLTDS